MPAKDLKFHEEEFFYKVEQPTKKGIFDKDLPDAEAEPELLGIRIRLGNEPIVYNLKELMELSGSKLSPELELQFKNHDVYIITHAIGVVRIQGRAKVKELQYNAEVVGLDGVRTIDLLPNTNFKKVFEVNTDLHGAFEAGGRFSAEIPDELTKALSGKKIDLGGDLKLELSASSNFVGKINFSVQLPVVQSIGVASNKCLWILNPDMNPLLGDQLMVQTIAVPKGTTEITYKMKGLVKVDKGLFSATVEKETSTFTKPVKLN